MPIRRVSKTFNQVTGATDTVTQATGNIQAVILPFAATPKSILAEADNKIIEALVSGKIRFIIGAAKGAPFEPVANDILTIGANTYTLLGCSPLAPAGVPIIYKMVAQITQATPDDIDTPITDWDQFGGKLWSELEAS